MSREPIIFPCSVAAGKIRDCPWANRILDENCLGNRNVMRIASETNTNVERIARKQILDARDWLHLFNGRRR